MFKTKLFAAICTGTSFVVAATTALTLAVSGPRNTQSLHMLSDNNAVAYGFTNLLSETASGFNTISNIVDTVSEQKASIAGSFTINSIEDFEELSGMGAGFEINFDADNNAFSLIGTASYGSMDVLKATLYMDKDELIAEVPSLFKGIITAPLDNLAEDFSNSYFGELAAKEGFDFGEFQDELNAAVESAMNEMPQFDFDYEEFYDGLMDTINDSYFKATDNMTVTDLGKKPLQSGDKYQCYRAELPVADLSYIAKDALMYILKSDEFGAFMDQVMEYMETSSYNDLDSYGSSLSYSSQLQSVAPMIEMYWGQVVTELESVFGKNIVFTIYLDNSVNTAGFEFYVSLMEDGTVSYEESDIETSVVSFVFEADLTGGKNIGDYADYTFAYMPESERDSFEIKFSKHMEENGDFAIYASMDEVYYLAEISAEGSYTDNDPFFTCNIDSLKVMEDGNTLFDVGFKLSFQPIDKVEKPSGSPEYNVWEMDEDDFEALGEEILDALKEINSLIE